MFNLSLRSVFHVVLNRSEKCHRVSIHDLLFNRYGYNAWHQQQSNTRNSIPFFQSALRHVSELRGRLYELLIKSMVMMERGCMYSVYDMNNIRFYLTGNKFSWKLHLLTYFAEMTGCLIIFKTQLSIHNWWLAWVGKAWKEMICDMEL